MSCESDIGASGFACAERRIEGSVEIAVWKDGIAHAHEPVWVSLDDLGAKPVIREGREVLDYTHYRSLLEVKGHAGARQVFALASLSPDDPRICTLHEGARLLVGSFQTLYGIATETGSVEFEIVVPEGGEVSQLEPVKRPFNEVALVVSETTVRCVTARGAVLWVLNFADRVKLTDITDREVTCVSLEPGSSGISGSRTYHISTGLPIGEAP